MWIRYLGSCIGKWCPIDRLWYQNIFHKTRVAIDTVLSYTSLAYWSEYTDEYSVELNIDVYGTSMFSIYLYIAHATAGLIQAKCCSEIWRTFCLPDFLCKARFQWRWCYRLDASLSQASISFGKLTWIMETSDRSWRSELFSMAWYVDICWEAWIKIGRRGYMKLVDKDKDIDTDYYFFGKTLQYRDGWVDLADHDRYMQVCLSIWESSPMWTTFTVTDMLFSSQLDNY